MQPRSRLRRAKGLLALTSRQMADVARAAGFDDPYYFSRLLHAKEGVSPSEFRVQQRLRADSRTRTKRGLDHP
jgi:transcriptional regulator GlxA family with amidase domain